MEVGQIVLVRWLDACGHEEWHTVQESEYGLLPIDTVGFVAVVTDEYVTLMSSLDASRDLGGSGVSIPRAVIAHCEVLRE